MVDLVWKVIVGVMVRQDPVVPEVIYPVTC